MLHRTEGLYKEVTYMFCSDIQYLWCPVCQADLSITVITGTEEIIDLGYLECESCEERYPIINRIVNLLPPDIRNALLTYEEKELAEEMLATGIQSHPVSKDRNKVLQSSFNWSKQFGEYFPVTREQLDSSKGFWSKQAFYSYAGIDEEQLEDKSVAVFCGGTGREAYHLGNAKTKKVIVLDIGSYISFLPQLLSGMAEKFLFIRCDVFYSPIKSESVDIAVCDHALQHISNHDQAYKNISNVVTGKGITSICVYSFENNFLMTKIGEPLKRVLVFVPLRTLFYLSLVPASLLYIFTLVVASLSKVISSKYIERIPLSRILLLWYENGFNKFREACFDLLQAPISHHFKKEELRHLAETNGQTILKLENTFSTMWTLVTTPSGTGFRSGATGAESANLG